MFHNISHDVYHKISPKYFAFVLRIVFEFSQFFQVSIYFQKYV